MIDDSPFAVWVQVFRAPHYAPLLARSEVSGSPCRATAIGLASRLVWRCGSATDVSASATLQSAQINRIYAWTARDGRMPYVSATPDETIRSRLRKTLGDTLKRGDRVAVDAVRSTLGAIDNAEAVRAPTGPLEPTGDRIAGAVSGVGRSDVPRRVLSEYDVRAMPWLSLRSRKSVGPVLTSNASGETLRPDDCVPKPFCWKLTSCSQDTQSSPGAVPDRPIQRRRLNDGFRFGAARGQEQ